MKAAILTIAILSALTGTGLALEQKDAPVKPKHDILHLQFNKPMTLEKTPPPVEPTTPVDPVADPPPTDTPPVVEQPAPAEPPHYDPSTPTQPKDPLTPDKNGIVTLNMRPI